MKLLYEDQQKILAKQQIGRTIWKKRLFILFMVTMLVLVLSIQLPGCSSKGRDIDIDELSEVMQKLHDYMHKVLTTNPYSWPEYEQYVEMGSKDYGIISDQVQKAYETYDEVIAYVSRDIFQEVSPEVLEEVDNLRSYVYLGADYAYTSLNLLYTGIKLWNTDVDDFLRHNDDILNNIYMPAFIEEYNRVCKRNGLPQIEGNEEILYLHHIYRR